MRNDTVIRGKVPTVEGWRRCRVVRVVCGLAVDATDAALILDALGLEPAEGKQL